MILWRLLRVLLMRLPIHEMERMGRKKSPSFLLIYLAIRSRHTPLVSADSGNFGSHRIDCFRARIRIPGVVYLKSQLASHLVVLAPHLLSFLTSLP